MKYVLLVGDGMADLPIDELNGITPLESLPLPAMAEVAGGALGRLRSCPPGLPPGSDVAFLTLLGYDAREVYNGRSPLEAAGEQIALGEGDVSLRVNLITIDGDYPNGAMASYNGSGIAGEDAAALMNALLGDAAFRKLMARMDLSIHATETFRHVAITRAEGDALFGLTPPHDFTGEMLVTYRPFGAYADLFDAMQRRAFEVLNDHPVNDARRDKGLAPANGIWFWGEGRATVLEPFYEKYGVRGTVVSAVPLVRGIGWLCGLRAPRIPGATGELDTNYAGKVEATLHALSEGDDFALIHIEAPDDESHLGSLEGKLEAIRRIDAHVLRPLLDGLRASGEPFHLLLMPDHYTLLSTRTHDGSPVPYALYDSRDHGESRPFCERACAEEAVIEDGDLLMEKLFQA